MENCSSMAFSDSHIAQQVEKHFPRTAHHIFNIMIEQTPPNTKLQISKAFWVKYCESLSNQVFPKLPCRSTEEVELTKNSDGKEHNVDIDDSKEDSDSRPNKIRKTSPYDNFEAANKTKPVSETNTDHENQGIGTNNNNKRPSSEAATKFFTDNPYFQVKLRAHQLRGNGNLYIPVAIANSWFEKKAQIYIPVAIANSWFEKKAQIVSLWVGEEYWHVNLTINKGSSSSGLEHRFSSGWAAFARDNSLQKSDVCIFELINKNQPEIKVTIFRQNEISMIQQ
ncbi:B3 domain-containing protein REM19-like [Cannabis sativa]|uniref:B3 domain-containing protein REM19-like n=1 Tax=Cannabis sativa TaxID=3483 RepID=UPI0029CA1675|nr:B3 domain-containing protein REM19-like [Cannabis sativa]